MAIFYKRAVDCLDAPKWLREQAPNFPYRIRVGDTAMPGEVEVSSMDDILSIRKKFNVKQQAMDEPATMVPMLVEQLPSGYKVNAPIVVDGEVRIQDPNSGVVVVDPEQAREVSIQVVDGVLTIVPVSGSPRYSKEKVKDKRERKRRKARHLREMDAETLAKRARREAKKKKPDVAKLAQMVEALAEVVVALQAAITVNEQT